MILCMKKMKFFILIMISKIGVFPNLIKKRFIEPLGFQLYSSRNTKSKLLKKLMLLVKIKKNVSCFERKI